VRGRKKEVKYPADRGGCGGDERIEAGKGSERLSVSAHLQKREKSCPKEKKGRVFARGGRVCKAYIKEEPKILVPARKPS